MNKRIICLSLCIVLLVSCIPVSANANEVTYYQVKIDAGNGVQTERAIIEDGEIFIAATSFSKFTRFEYHEDIHTFLVKGQQAADAFKKVIVNAETKKAAVGTKLIELCNSFVIDGVTYLPFCQMLPILNANILKVGSDVIYIVNNEVSMAELLYGFDINDYRFDLSEEFLDNNWLIAGYVGWSYVFDTVVNFRFDRLDIVFESGNCEDYQGILSGYLKDDDLFYEAMSQKNTAGELIEDITGLIELSEPLNDVYEWFEKIAKLEIAEEDKDFLEFDDLELFIKNNYHLSESYEDELEMMVRSVHEDLIPDNVLKDVFPGGLSIADLLDGIDYLYTLLNQVEDHRKMLDAVYGITNKQSEYVPGASSNITSPDPEYLAAKEVYELYSGDIIPAYTEKVTEEVFERILEDQTVFNAAGVYKLTAGLAGSILELYMAGDSGDRALLPLHTNIMNSAMRKAAVPILDTEKSTNEYRLSLLLMLISSKSCYEILSETAEDKGQDVSYYQSRINKIENLIKGLYLVAENVAFDTYENFDDYAVKNRKIISESGVLSQATDLLIPTQQPDFEIFLQNNPEYIYYAILDVNQDGTSELLATESDCSQWGSAFAEVDLFVYRDGEIQLAYENLWSKNFNLMYSKDNKWIEASVSGTGGGGVEFYYLDENLNVQKLSYEVYLDYDENGNEVIDYYLNGRKVVTEEDQEAFDRLVECYNEGDSSDIIFQPIPIINAPEIKNNRLSQIKIISDNGSEYEHLFYYNKSGKLSLIEQSGYIGSNYDYYFSYDGNGRLIKMESGDIEEDFYEYRGREFSYDNMGRLSSAQIFGAGFGWQPVDYSYNEDQRLVQRGHSLEGEYDYSIYEFAYDARGNWSEVWSIYPEYDYRSVWSYQYDQWNRVTKEVHTEQYSDGTEYVDELSYSYDYAPFVFCYSEYNIRVYYDFGLLYGEKLNPWISENANVFEPADFHFDEIVDIATDEHGQITALTVASEYSEGTTTYYFFYSDETNSVENTEIKERFQYKNINFSASDILSFEDPEFERFLCVMLGKNRGTITGQDLLSIEYFGYFEGSPTEAESLTNYWDKDTLYWNSVLVSTEPCPDYLDERDVLCLTAGEDGLNYRRRGTLVIVQSNEWMAEHVFPYLYYFKNVDRFAFAYCWMGDLVCMPTDANWCQINAHSRDFHLPYDPDYS